MTTSLATDSAGAARSLDCLKRLSLAPDQAAAKVEEMRPAVETGDGAAMLAAFDQARAWWDAFDVAQWIIGDRGRTPDHLTHGWGDLMELVTHAPASSPTGVLAKVRLAAWTKSEQRGDAEWDVVLVRTLNDRVAALAAMEGQRHG